MENKLPPILQIGDVLLSSDLLTEEFCCDLDVCHGACCVEGDAGAPVTLDEIMEIENSLDAVWGDLSASAQSVIDRQGVAYTDRDGDLVTSIVGGKDCVFTCYEPDGETVGNGQPIVPGGFPAGNGRPPVPGGFPAGKGRPTVPGGGTAGGGGCLCALEKAFREGRSSFCKPVSCALYPIREKQFSDGSIGLNYHRWDICECGRRKGRELHLKVYQFLKEPLLRRFGEEWYQELCDVAKQLNAE